MCSRNRWTSCMILGLALVLVREQGRSSPKCLLFASRWLPSHWSWRCCWMRQRCPEHHSLEEMETETSLLSCETCLLLCQTAEQSGFVWVSCSCSNTCLRSVGRAVCIIQVLVSERYSVKSCLFTLSVERMKDVLLHGRRSLWSRMSQVLDSEVAWFFLL